MVAPEAVFTGERLVAGDPLFVADLSRHLAAYRFAQARVRCRAVLDAGCGDGYGTDLLAASAARAVGVDRDRAAIAAASRRYRRPNLRFVACELDRIASLGEQFDIVSNFQVIEHLRDPVPFLEQVRRILHRGGELILTTPNRLMSPVENPYHVHEYEAEELRALLGRFFPQVVMLGVFGDERVVAYERARAANAGCILRLDPIGFRRLVPRRVVEFLYPRLARWVRRRIARSGVLSEPVTVENFAVRAVAPDALDLLAICSTEAAPDVLAPPD